MGGLDGFPGWGGLTEQVAEALNKRKAAEQAAGGCRAGPGSAEQAPGGGRAGIRSCHKLGGDGAVASSGDKLELSQARGDGAVTSSGGWSCHKLCGLRRPQLLGRKVG